jgi:preprotein translocase subunit SecG
MIVPDELFVASQRRNVMKKLMTMMLAVSFLAATVAVSFADEPKQDTEKKKKSKKKKTTAPTAATIR